MILLQDKLEIKKFDNNRWVISSNTGRNFILNEESITLLEILQISVDQTEALSKFQTKFNSKISFPEFQTLVERTFNGLGILKGESPKSFSSTSYLSLQIPLIPSRIASKISKPFTIFFSLRTFWFYFSSLFLLNIIMCAHYFSSLSIILSRANLMLLPILFGASMLVHEIGHIAACKKFNIKHGNIGFGFYIIFPVVYADITQVWNATKRQRLITNAAGVYLELLYSVILIFSFLITADGTFIVAAVGVFIKAVTELNPFLRYDGYWLLSDATETPNLMKKSKETASIFFSLRRKNDDFHFWSLKLKSTSRDLLMLLYSIFNSSIVFVYIVWVIFNYHQTIQRFPLILFDAVKQLAIFNLSIKSLPDGFLLVFGLYLLFLKQILKFIRIGF